jgi:hypothetical protein
MYLNFNFLDYFRFMVFNANFNNISAISWQLVLLMEEIGVPGENHWVTCTDYTQRWLELWVRVMVFNAPFSNISDISWRPVLLAEETGVTNK